MRITLLDGPFFWVQLLQREVSADITFFNGMPSLTSEKPSRIPRSGEALILVDGRRFHIAAAENGLRGWWFSATALDGRSTLQGNMRLEWDSHARAWRPLGARNNGARRVMRRTAVARHEQLD